MNIKIGLIEDEINSQNLLISKIKTHFPKGEIVFSAETVEQGIELLDESNIDILFLDIELKDGTGFDLLSSLSQIDFQIIFTTAYDQFALKAFEVNAVDYLLKPINDEALIRSMNRAMSRKTIEQEDVLEKISSLFQSQSNTDRIVIREHGKVIFLRPQEIIYFKAERAYCNIFHKNGTRYMCSQNVGYFDKKLAGSKFIRIHRSFLVNPDYIEEFFTADHLVKLSNGDIISVSSKMTETLINKLESADS